MHYIKRYANRRLYHTEEKQYITLDRLRKLVEAGEKVKIVDTKSRKDITTEMIARFREEGDAERPEVARTVSDLFEKGGKMLGRMADAALEQYRDNRRPDSQQLLRWVGDRVRNSRKKARSLSQEASEYAEPVVDWIREQVDKSVEELHARINVASRDRVDELSRRIAALEKKLHKYEKQQP